MVKFLERFRIINTGTWVPLLFHGHMLHLVVISARMASQVIPGSISAIRTSNKARQHSSTWDLIRSSLVW
jgi:hypothetical protein